MARRARSFDDAYFENEKGSRDPVTGAFFNKYKEKGSGGINIQRNLINYLDPSNYRDTSKRGLRQPQDWIPKSFQGILSRYDLYVGSKTLKKVQEARTSKTSMPLLKISLLFGVGQDLDNLGLRHYFEQVNDRVLINIPGREPDWIDIPGRKRLYIPSWGIGITGLKDSSRQINDNQIKSLMTDAGLQDVPYKIATLAAYSTGYSGLNQTINEGLIPLGDIEIVVYYDCTYRADKPKSAPGDPKVILTPAETNPGPDEENRKGHSGSAFNTQRARKRILDATDRKTTFVAYMATSGGSPWYLHPSPTPSVHQYTVDFPTKIDLRAAAPGFPFPFTDCLFALALTRCLAYAQIDGQVTAAEIPPAFKDLEGVLPQRGQVASTTATLHAKDGLTPSTTLLDWGRINQTKVKNALKQKKTAINLISERKLMYPEGYPLPNNPGGVLHAALLPEFAWEFLL